MPVIIDELLAPPQVIGSGCDISTLTRCLEFAVREKPEAVFKHFRPIPGMDRSIRLFGHYPFAGSVQSRYPLDPHGLTKELMKYSHARQPEDRARYRQMENPSAMKGWTISRSVDFLDEQGYPIIAAYATWHSISRIDP